MYTTSAWAETPSAPNKDCILFNDTCMHNAKRIWYNLIIVLSCFFFLHKGELVHNINTNADQGTISLWILSSQCPFNFQGFWKKTQEKNKNMPNDIYYRFINPNTYIHISTTKHVPLQDTNAYCPLRRSCQCHLTVGSSYKVYTHPPTCTHLWTIPIPIHQWSRRGALQSCVWSVIRLELG